MQDDDKLANNIAKTNSNNNYDKQIVKTTQNETVKTQNSNKLKNNTIMNEDKDDQEIF